MLKNYLKTAIRNLLKNKGNTFINIFGVATGIACCILIVLFVRHEWQHDAFHKNADNIYRMVMHQKSADGSFGKNTFFPKETAETIVAEFPAVTHATGLIRTWNRIRYGTEQFRAAIGEVDNGFLQMFTFPLIVGDPATALKEPDNIVISKSFAEKLFSDIDGDYTTVIGKVLSVHGKDVIDFIITGVMEDFPKASSFQFEVLISIEHYRNFGVSNNWAGAKTVYIQLADGQNTNILEASLPPFAEKLLIEKFKNNQPLALLGDFQDVVKVTLQPLSDIYLDDETFSHYSKAGNATAGYIMVMIAFLVLAIACINFTTLSVGKSSRRAMEVGMRKALGARRTQLMAQFWGEALLLSLFSLIIGIILAKLLLPLFNALAQKELALNIFADPGLILILFTVMLLTGLFAGSYPALVLSGFRPVSVFKGETGIGKPNKLTRSLVVLQYTLSIALMIVTGIMSQQLTYLLNKDLGYNQEQVVIVSTPTQETNERMKTQIRSHERIISVGASDRSFTSGWQTRGLKNDAGEWVSVRQIRIDPDYLKALEIPLLQGRNFSYERPVDVKESVLVNEAFVKELAWADPVGKQLKELSWGEEDASPTVIGVVKDFHIDKLDRELQPLLMHMNPDQHGLYRLFVRIKPDDISGTMDFLKANWEEIAPDIPFSSSFLDENLENQYREEQRWRQIVGYASIFAILISCLGLLGLAALDVARRTKEIGIRKVLGASVTNLVSLLSKEFLLLLLIANVIAWPVAYFSINFWLQNFAYKIDPGWFIFLGAGFLAVLIALLTVSFQSIKAALANPVKSLRYE